MGAVFIILLALIAIITIVAKIVPEEVPALPVRKDHGVDPAHVAAISAAIHLHRKNR
jgi:Na+-transporting methylmalonyl-CoA/oxaloacetate decarboxylase gamma subunit